MVMHYSPRRGAGFYPREAIGQEDGRSEVVLEEVIEMPHTSMVRFETKQWAQCRNEAPFPVVVVMVKTPKGVGPTIDCPHCHRGYRFEEGSDQWIADRPLVFFETAEEVEEARKHCIH